MSQNPLHDSQSALRGQPKEGSSLADKSGNDNIAYGTSYISGDARAVFGNVIHHHTHFHGKASPVCTQNPGDKEEYQQLVRHTTNINPETISEYNSQYEHWLRSKKRLAGTYKWLFSTPEYESWLSPKGPPILICTGSVGSGKSVIASAVVDELSCSQLRSPPIVVSYYVDGFRNDHVTLAEILNALMKQLISYVQEKSNPLPEILRNQVQQIFSTKRCFLDIDGATKCFQSFLREIDNSFFIIDGVDAMTEKEISKFFRFLRIGFDYTSNTPKHRVIIFCRDTLGRGIRLEGLANTSVMQIGISQLKSDIHSYVNHEVTTRQSERSISSTAELIEEIKTVLKEHSEKMFVWIQLQLSSLWDPGLITCDEDIRRQLHTLPDGLDDIYIRCLQKIEDTNDKRSQEIAPKAFRWVAAAREPLTPLQAREAVSLRLDSMPMKKSMVLNSPVEDYCANLLVLDDLTGRIKFPHPTVKEFLQDPVRLPSNLSKYKLSKTEDDLWCGEICLAYISYFHCRKQLVAYRPQEIDADVASPILDTVPGGWLAKLRLKPRESSSFRLKLPKPRRPFVNDIADLHLHRYMCKYWLFHNQHITADNNSYPLFLDLCLSNDAQILPWDSGGAVGVHYYQSMVQYGVMTDHVALLRLAKEHLRQNKSRFELVFQRPCPGTESTTWLHMCAALGHTSAADTLIDVCDHTIADEQGKSAAALAVENGHTETFALLIRDSFAFTPLRWLPSFTSTLVGPRSGFTSARLGSRVDFRNRQHVAEENILRTCASYGNIEAFDMVFSRINWSKNRALLQQFLSDALLHAAYHAHESTAEYLVNQGADPSLFRLLPDHLYYRSEFDLIPGDLLSLRTALLIRSAKCMDILLKVGRYSTFEQDDCDVLDVVDHFQGEYLKAEPFLIPLIRHERMVNGHKSLITTSWTSLFFQRMSEADFRASGYWNRCLELIVSHLQQQPQGFVLNTLRHSSLDGDGHRSRVEPSSLNAVFQGTYGAKRLEVKCMSPNATWLSRISDTLFHRLFNTNPSDWNHLLHPACVRAIAERQTSRALQSLIAWLEYDKVLDHAFQIGPDDEHSVPILSHYLCYRFCSNHLWNSAFEQNDETERASLLLQGYRKHLNNHLYPEHDYYAQLNKHDYYAQLNKHDYYAQLKDIMSLALTDRRTQVYAVLRYYEIKPHKSIKIQEMYKNETKDIRFGAPTIAWLSCCRFTQVKKAHTMLEELTDCGSDANFDLNFPWGYTLSYSVRTAPGPLTRGLPHVVYAVDRRILVALYGWAFRLRFRRGEPLSSSGVCYIAWCMIEWLKKVRAARDDAVEGYNPYEGLHEDFP